MSVSESVPVRSAGRPRVTSSAMSQAREILQNTPADTPRKDIVAQFVELGLKKSVASSYYTILNKSVKRS